MNENLSQVTEYWILSDRLPYTLNRSTQARRSNYSIKAQQIEKHNTCYMPPNKKSTTKGRSEREQKEASKEVQACATINVK
jgi:lipocalin